MSSDELRPKPTVDAAQRHEAELKLAQLQEQIAQMQPEKYAFEPKEKTPLWVSILVGTLASTAPIALTMVPAPWGILVAAVLGGLATGIGAHFGIKSAGVKSSSDSKH